MSRRSSFRLTAFLMAGALFGKLLGFLREMEMARLLGANIVADSFRGALTAILLPIAPMQGDMVPSVLIPLHRQWKAEGVAVGYFSSLTAILGSVSLTITILVWIFAERWVDVLVGGFGPEAHAITVQLTRIMALAMPAATISACMSCVEISVGRSRITTMRASVQNVGVMIGIAIMAYTGNPLAIGWGFVCAFNSIVIYGTVCLWLEGELRLREVRFRNMKPAIKAFFRRMRPLFAQPFADQGNILLERYLGSTLVVGTLASLDYARTLTETALYLVSQPIGYVVLAQNSDESTTKDRVSALCRPLLGLALPASAFILVFAPDIVRIVFERGAFDERAVGLTANALRGIGVGLWAATIGWILIRMINAAGRNGVAARIIIASYAANILLNLGFSELTNIGVMGLGLGEASRGLIMFAGAAIMLGCGSIVLKNVLRVMPFAVALAALGLLVQYEIHSSLLRVLVGAVVFGLGAAIILLPEIKQIYRQWRARRNKKAMTVPIGS